MQDIVLGTRDIVMNKSCSLRACILVGEDRKQINNYVLCWMVIKYFKEKTR